MDFLNDQYHRRRDLKMLESGFRHGWRIPTEVLESLPSKLLHIIDGQATNREKIAAARVLVQMQKSAKVTDPTPNPAEPVPEFTADMSLEVRRQALLQYIDGMTTEPN